MSSQQLALDLSAQALAVAEAADTASGRHQEMLSAGSRSLALAATRASKRAAHDRSAQEVTAAVLDVEPNASPAVFNEARTRRAVRRGKDVYLPSWSDVAVGLPNVLLRSALWTAGETSEVNLENATIAVLGDLKKKEEDRIGVLFTGRQLTQYDRRVFVACLEHYAHRPLSPGGELAPWVQVSFWELAQAMGNAYTLNTHIALRASLLRLEAANLRVRFGKIELPVPRLVEVAFADGYRAVEEAHLKGSDKLAFRVLEQLAVLYGPTSWTAVPKPALEMKGLRGWLSGFYATHATPQQVTFEALHRLSGMGCRLNDFRTRVCAALDELKGPQAPDKLRVANYTVSPDRTAITVRLARWSGTHKLSQCS